MDRGIIPFVEGAFCPPGAVHRLNQALKNGHRSSKTLHVWSLKVPHSMSKLQIVSRYLTLPGENQSAAISLEDLAVCGKLSDNEPNWCWVTDGGSEYFLPIQQRTQNLHRLWMVGSHSAAEQNYSPFDCHIVFRGTKEQPDPDSKDKREQNPKDLSVKYGSRKGK